jgi:hypothetical protein
MEFNITSSTLNSNYEYKDAIIVIGSFVKNAVNGTLRSISGDCYRKNAAGEQGDYIGNFTGTPDGNEIVYDLSQMKRSDSNLVWNAIEDIEGEILGSNE